MRHVNLFFLLVSGFIQAQNHGIPKGMLASNQHHEGIAWLNFLGQANTLFDHNVVLATFEAGAKLNWHSHKEG